MKNKIVVTLEDLEIKHKNILKQNPKVKRCSVKGCNNPIDSTEFLREGTCCAYHRILFDYWSCEVQDQSKFYYYLENQKARRTAFTKWRNRIGKEACDKIVLKLANELINWVC